MAVLLSTLGVENWHRRVFLKSQCRLWLVFLVLRMIVVEDNDEAYNWHPLVGEDSERPIVDILGPAEEMYARPPSSCSWR